MFAGIFGNLGLNHSLALSEIIMHTMVSTSTGSINWINIMIWLFILFFEMGVMFLCSSNILTQVFKFKSRYVPLPQSSLELAESLEQLRWLENGYKIKVGISEVETIGIDTPQDLERAEEFLKNRS